MQNQDFTCCFYECETAPQPKGETLIEGISEHEDEAEIYTKYKAVIRNLKVL
jgi:hypothetical protein